MGIELRELYQVLSILKRLAQLLHPRLRTVYTIDALHREDKTLCLKCGKVKFYCAETCATQTEEFIETAK